MSTSTLTASQVVRQSQLCHPDWGVRDHVDYLRFECPWLDHATVTAAVPHIADWLMGDD